MRCLPFIPLASVEFAAHLGLSAALSCAFDGFPLVSAIRFVPSGFDLFSHPAAPTAGDESIVIFVDR